MKSIFIEAGINHFGNIKEANYILSYFLKSKFTNLTFMLHTKEFYNSQKKRGINFKLTKNFYISAIKKCHQKNKMNIFFIFHLQLSKNQEIHS